MTSHVKVSGLKNKKLHKIHSTWKMQSVRFASTKGNRIEINLKRPRLAKLLYPSF